MSTLKWDQTAVLVLAEEQGQIRVYTELPDLLVLALLSKALDNLSKLDQTNKEPQVCVVTVILDSEKKVLLTANAPQNRVKSLLTKIAQEVLFRTQSVPTAVSTPGVIKTSPKIFRKQKVPRR
jgi:hypothetical protein